MRRCILGTALRDVSKMGATAAGPVATARSQDVRPSNDPIENKRVPGSRRPGEPSTRVSVPTGFGRRPPSREDITAFIGPHVSVLPPETARRRLLMMSNATPVAVGPADVGVPV